MVFSRRTPGTAGAIRAVTQETSAHLSPSLQPPSPRARDDHELRSFNKQRHVARLLVHRFFDAPVDAANRVLPVEEDLVAVLLDGLEAKPLRDRNRREVAL